MYLELYVGKPELEHTTLHGACLGHNGSTGHTILPLATEEAAPKVMTSAQGGYFRRQFPKKKKRSTL